MCWGENMDKKILSQIMELKTKPLAELKAKYKELFPEDNTSSNNKMFLWRKIAYRIQELAFGGLPKEAQDRIQELIQKYDPINNKSLRPNPANNLFKENLARDRRLPIPGTIITKKYKGVTIEVKVLDKGFEYKNKIYRSLSAVAKEITGDHWNGYLFFNL